MKVVGNRRLTKPSAPTLPLEAAWLWGAYCDLELSFQTGMGWAFSYTETAAYAALHGFRWERSELELIRGLFRARLILEAEDNKRGPSK